VTSWRLWEQHPDRPPPEPKQTKMDSPDRRQMRRLCQGRIVVLKTGSKRWQRRRDRRLAREKARVKQGLLPRMLRP
jgi:hypothetical protein